MPRFWVMAPVESKPADLFDRVWQFDLAANVISIGWKELGDVSGLTRDGLNAAVAKASLDKPSRLAVHERSSRLAAAFGRICGMVTSLTQESVIASIVADEAEIRALGVARLALFGSVLRGEATPDSDVDILVEFVPGSKSFDRFLALAELLEERLGQHVDLVTTEALSPFIGPRILSEARDVLRAA